MNIFISWSGDRSHQVALLFKDWIKGVVQAAKPWVSSEDIESGTRWFAQISEQIDATSHGVICITRENKEKPWILYEAGALSKGQGNAAYVIPLLVDLENQDIVGPLAQFNAVVASKKESMSKLVLDLNKRLPNDSIIDETVLKKVFAAFWPDFETGLAKIIDNTKATAPPKKKREEDSMIVEILNTVRNLDKRMKTLEVGAPNDLLTLPGGVILKKEVFGAGRATAHSKPEMLNDVVVMVQEGVKIGLGDNEILDVVFKNYPLIRKEFILNRLLDERKNSQSV